MVAPFPALASIRSSKRYTDARSRERS